MGNKHNNKNRLKAFQYLLSELSEECGNTLDEKKEWLFHPVGVDNEILFVPEKVSFQYSDRKQYDLTVEGRVENRKVSLSYTSASGKEWVMEYLINNETVTPKDVIAWLGMAKYANFIPTTLYDMTEWQIDEYRMNSDAMSLYEHTQIIITFHLGKNSEWEVIPGVLTLKAPLFRCVADHHRSDENHIHHFLRLTATCSLTASNIMVEASLTMNLRSPWLLAIKCDNLTIGGLASLFLEEKIDALVGDIPKGLLPEPLNVELKCAEICFDPFHPSLESVSFEVIQTERWEFLPNLYLYDWILVISMTIQKNAYKYRGILRGYIDVGKNLGIEMCMTLPLKNGICSFGLKKDTVLHFTGIGEVFNIFGNGIPKGLPCNLITLGNCNIEKLSIQCDLSNKQLKSVDFLMQSALPWVVIEDILVFNNVYVSLHAVRFGKDFDMLGEIKCTLELANHAIQLRAWRLRKNENWLFKFVMISPLHIPGLEEMATWFLPEQFVRKLPSAVMPFGQGFDLIQLEFFFNATEGNFEKLEFGIRNCMPWVIVEDCLALDNTDVCGKITTYGVEKELDLSISAHLCIDEAVIVFKADYQKDKPWILHVGLEKQVAFTLDSLLLLLKMDKDFLPPHDLGLPVLAIDKLEGEVVPQEKRFNLSGSVTFSADIDVLGLHFRMFNVQVTVEVNKGELRKVYLGCTLYMERLQFAASLNYGAEDTPVVFWGSLVASDFTLSTFSEKILPNSWNGVAPADMIPVKYKAGAIARLDASASQIDMAGKIEGIGTLFFHSCQTTHEGTRKGYAICFVLDDSFRFASLLKNLSVIDELFGLYRASLLVCSYEVEREDLRTATNVLLNYDGNSLALPVPFPDELVPEAKLQAGTHMYAEIQLKGWLGNLIERFVELDTQTAVLSLYAQLPSDSADSHFIIRLPAFSLLGNTVGMPEGAQIEYISGVEKTFAMTGKVAVSLFGKIYDFNCHLSINEKKVTWDTVLDTEKRSAHLFPETVPDFFELHDFLLNGSYTFATDETEKHLELVFKGGVHLGKLECSAALHVVNGIPVFAWLQLENDLCLSELVSTIVGNSFNWPAHVFDIVLRGDTPERRSLLYYYAPPEGFQESGLSVPSGLTLRNGYCLEVAVDFTFLYTVSFSLCLHIKKDKGVEATVALDKPVNLFIVELASTTLRDGCYTSGPELYLRSQEKNICFGLRTGLNLLGYGFGTADILIERTKTSGGQEEMRLTACTSVRKVPVFGSLALKFTYSSSQGLSFDDLPKELEYIGCVIDLAKGIKEVMEAASCTSGDVCGIITNLICEVAYKDCFTLLPSFDCDMKGNMMYLTLNGKYSVSVGGIPLGSIPFDDIIKIGIKADTSFDNLDTLITNALQDMGESFVKGLISNSESCAKMLVLLFGKEGAKIAAQMLCLGLTESIMVEAVNAGIAAGGGAAAVAAIIRTLSGGGSSGGGGKPGGGDEPSGGDDPSGGSQPSEGSNPEIPQLNGDLVFEGNRMKIRWRGARYAAGYEVQFLQPGDRPMGEIQYLGYDINEASVEIPSLLDAGMYKAQVRSVRGDRKSDWASVAREKLASSACLLTLDKQHKEITLQVTLEIKDATYNFALQDKEGHELITSVLAKPIIKIKLDKAELRMEGVRGSVYISKNGFLPGERSISLACIHTISNPTEVILDMEGASWKNVEKNKGYKIIFRYGELIHSLTVGTDVTNVALPVVPNCDVVALVHTLGDQYTIEEDGETISNTLPFSRLKPIKMNSPIQEESGMVTLTWTSEALPACRRIEIQCFCGTTLLNPQPEIRFYYGKAKVLTTGLKRGEAYRFRARVLYARDNELLFYSPEKSVDEVWTICDTMDNGWLRKRFPEVHLPDGLWRKQSQVIDLNSYVYDRQQLLLKSIIKASLHINQKETPYCLYVELWDSNYGLLQSEKVISSTSGKISFQMECPQQSVYIYIEYAGLKNSAVSDISLRLILNEECVIKENSEWSDYSPKIVLI